MTDRQDTDKRHKLMAYMDSKKPADYLRGLEAGRAETAAAVAAALMQAAEAVKREAWPDDDIYGPDEKQIESAERATVEVAVETILALIPARTTAPTRARRG